MGASRIRELCENLINSGYAENTPCAVIENGSRHDQKIIRGNLKNINSAKSPAIIIIGENSKLNLRCKRPLENLKIIVTRPAERACEISKLLRDAGAEVVNLPMIKTEIIKNSLDNKNISGYDYLAFTSVTGVRALFEILKIKNRDVREIGNAKIAAVGLATADELKNFGLRVDFIPEIFDVENLIKGLSGSGGSGKILMFRADEINTSYANENINELKIYKVNYVKNIMPENFNIVIFTSASTVRGFIKNYDMNLKRDFICVCIGVQTAEECRKYNLKNIKIAERATTHDLYKCVMSCVE